MDRHEQFQKVIEYAVADWIMKHIYQDGRNLTPREITERIQDASPAVFNAIADVAGEEGLVDANMDQMGTG